MGGDRVKAGWVRFVVAFTLAFGSACGDQDEPRGEAAAPRASEVLAQIPAGFQLRAADVDHTRPDLAVGPDEVATLGLAWLAFDGRSDQVQVMVWRDGAWEAPLLLSDGPGTYFAPRIVADPDGGWFCVWGAKRGDHHQIEGRSLREGVLGPLRAISTGQGVAAEPVVVAGADGLWVAWESFRDGRFDLFGRRRRGGEWGPELRLTDHPRSDVQPTLAMAANGRVWIAWMSWREGTYETGNYEIFAAAWERDGLVDVARVSRSPRVDMFPELVARPSGMALVWTEARFPVRDNDGLRTIAYKRWTDKRYQVARWSAEGWAAPREIRVGGREKPAAVPTDRASPIAGPGDELWILFGELASRALMDRGWATKVARIDGEGISVPVDLSMGSTGRDGRIATAWLDGELWLAEMLTAEAGAQHESPRSWIRVQRTGPHVLPPRRPLEPADAPREPPAPEGRLLGRSVGRGGGMTREHAGKRWKAWFGNLHNHSNFSRDRRGFNGSPSQAFRSVYDVAELDFTALTDHVEWLTDLDWWEIAKENARWNRPGDFVTLPSYEWTSFEYGHRNLVFPDADAAPVRFGSFHVTPVDLWAFLDENPAIAIPHHPSHALEKPMDWSFRNDRHQRLVEIFQNRGSYEYDGAPLQRTDLRPAFHEGHSVRDALDMGHRLGIIASPDHGGGMGLAGVWAETLSRESIFEALHARRTFGTTGAKMELFLTVEGHVQGSEVEWRDGPRRIVGSVRATSAPLALTLVVDGQEVREWRFEAEVGEIEWVDDEPLSTTRYYYLRARQGDGHIGWTSPVWVSPAAGR